MMTRIERAENKVKIYNALEQACREEAKAYAIIMTRVTTDQHAVRYGGMVPRIANVAGLPKAYVRRVLNAELRDGMVLVDPCRGGCSRWWPVGLWDKLQAERAEMERIAAHVRGSLADLIGQKPSVEQVTQRVETALQELAPPQLRINAAGINGDVLTVEFEASTPIGERAAQEGGAV